MKAFLKSLLTNYKTTSAGTAMILGAITDLLTSIAHGTPLNLPADLTAITGGIGLIAAGDSSAPPAAPTK